VLARVAERSDVNSAVRLLYITRMRSGGAMFAAMLLSACLKINPAYSTGDESESGGPVTSGEATTGAVETTSTGGETTAAIDQTTTGDTSGTASGSSVGETTGQSGEMPPLIPAEIATCVLTAIPELGHIGPAECEQRASAGLGLAGGGMIVDEAFNENGDGRPGIVFMRFAIPARLAGGQLTAATLVFEVADPDGADSGAGGAVRLAMPFEMADLETKAPGWVPGFETLVGAVEPGQLVEVALPLAAITAGAPLHVGIWPYSNDAAVYLSNGAAAERRPRLALMYSP
jgi:hypothetical protein